MTNTEFKTVNDTELAMVAGGGWGEDLTKWVTGKVEKAIKAIPISGGQITAVSSLLKNAYELKDLQKKIFIENAKNTVKGWFTS